MVDGEPRRRLEQEELLKAALSDETGAVANASKRRQSIALAKVRCRSRASELESKCQKLMQALDVAVKEVLAGMGRAFEASDDVLRG